MAAGCEFICENEKCEQCGTGFAILGAWPVGKIDLVIDARNVQKIETFVNELITDKCNGAKYACINYPNVNEIPTVGYRIEKWCDNCSMINKSNVKVGEGLTLEEALEKEDTSKCFKCDGGVRGFEDVIEEGIECPFCKEKMSQSRWHTNETCEETG